MPLSPFGTTISASDSLLLPLHPPLLVSLLLRCCCCFPRPLVPAGVVVVKLHHGVPLQRGVVLLLPLQPRCCCRCCSHRCSLAPLLPYNSFSTSDCRCCSARPFCIAVASATATSVAAGYCPSTLPQTSPVFLGPLLGRQQESLSLLCRPKLGLGLRLQSPLLLCSPLQAPRDSSPPAADPLAGHFLDRPCRLASDLSLLSFKVRLRYLVVVSTRARDLDLQCSSLPRQLPETGVHHLFLRWFPDS